MKRFATTWAWFWALLFSALLLSALLAPSGALAARPAATVQERAVDMLALVGGERLFGMLVAPPAGGEVKLLLRREWLRKHAPNQYQKATAGEDERQRAAIEALKERLIAWRERRDEPKLLVSFLDRNIAETEGQLGALTDGKTQPELAPLLLVSIPLAQVRKSYEQPPETRRLLGLAWEAELDGAEDLPASELAAQLKSRQIDVERGRPDLSDRIGLLPLDDRQWSAKMALAEYAILGKPHFQGLGTTLVREDSERERPALGELIAELAKSQLGDLLDDLLAPGGGNAARQDDQRKRAVVQATREADADGSIAARITQLDQDLARHRVTVSDSFWAKMPDGAWQPVWQFASSIDASQAKPGDEKKLEQDPQIAEALKLVKNLGLDIDPKQLQAAMRHGVATQEALQAVDAEFAEYLLANTRRLDGPPLLLPDALAAPRPQR